MSRVVKFESGPIANHQPDPNVGLFLVSHPWRAKWKLQDGRERRLFVPAGYIHDGMSVPPAGRAVTGLNPKSYPKGVVPHDALYRAMGGRKDEAWKGCILTNQNGNEVLVGPLEADDLLCFVMRIEGANLWRRAWVRSMTFAFGALYWGGPSPQFS